jgi:DNA-binding NarL/FixJ family response regulator
MSTETFVSSVNEPNIAVLLVEDDAMVRSWVERALEGSEFRLAGVATEIAVAVALAQRRSAGLLLVDYRLPDGVGTELVRGLRQLGVNTPAVLMTANPERGFNEIARESGAQGSVVKSGSAEELLTALRKVAAGEHWFDGRHPRRTPGRAALSPREREVLRLVASGKTNVEIAVELGVGAETVKTLLARTFTKLGAHRRAEAVAAATKLGLL